jgi:hypothetical protein
MLLGHYLDPRPVRTGQQCVGPRNQARHVFAIELRQPLQCPAPLAGWAAPIPHRLDGGRNWDTGEGDYNPADHQLSRSSSSRKTATATNDVRLGSARKL